MEAASRWVDMLWSIGVANEMAEWGLRRWVMEHGTMATLMAAKELQIGTCYNICHPRIEHPAMAHCRSYPPTATLSSFTKFCSTSLF